MDSSSIRLFSLNRIQQKNHSINILKIGITNLKVDAIVNAANEGLWEGGGVCGAIFREAGSAELAKACNAIGGCKTGNAVITPGFRLPAKYIIHAHPDYDMHVTFSVLDDGILDLGQQILQELR